MSNLSALALRYAAISTVISFFCVEHKDTILNFVSNNAVSKSLLDHQKPKSLYRIFNNMRACIGTHITVCTAYDVFTKYLTEIISIFLYYTVIYKYDTIIL